MRRIHLHTSGRVCLLVSGVLLILLSVYIVARLPASIRSKVETIARSISADKSSQASRPVPTRCVLAGPWIGTGFGASGSSSSLQSLQRDGRWRGAGLASDTRELRLALVRLVRSAVPHVVRPSVRSRIVLFLALSSDQVPNGGSPQQETGVSLTDSEASDVSVSFFYSLLLTSTSTLLTN